MRVDAAGLFQRLKRLLSRETIDRWIILVSVLLACASLDTGLGADDHIQQLVLRQSDAIAGFVREPLDLFSFAEPEFNESLRDEGVFPWWADTDTHLSLFRPFSSVTHWVDHQLWPSSYFMMHAHSIVWFALTLFGLAALYRRLIQPPWVAALALLVYAVDDARGAPIAWIANRNAVIACALSVWVLVFFHRYRAESWKPGAWAGVAVFTLALASGEGAIATGAYLLAYAICLDHGPWVRRFARLAPYGVLVVVWRAAVGQLGFGVEASGVYIDPVHEPAHFVAAVFERLPILLLAQLAAPWSDVWNASPLVAPGLEYGLMVLALAVIGLSAYLLAPLWRRDRVIRFWIVGAVLSAVPVCATFPADRLLAWVGIGASGVIAQLFAALVEDPAQRGVSPWLPRLSKLTAVGIVGLHMVVAPLTLPMRARGIVSVRRILMLADDSVPKGPEIADKTVVYVNPPADPFASYVPIMRADRGETRFAAQRWLATGATAVTVERIDRSTLRVRPEDGFLVSPSERMLRSSRRPMKKGEVVSLTGMQVTVTELTWDERPAEALVRFDTELEDPTFVWLKWQGRGYVPFDLPAVGETIELPAADFFEIAYGG